MSKINRKCYLLRAHHVHIFKTPKTEFVCVHVKTTMAKSPRGKPRRTKKPPSPRKKRKSPKRRARSPKAPKRSKKVKRSQSVNRGDIEPENCLRFTFEKINKRGSPIKNGKYEKLTIKNTGPNEMVLPPGFSYGFKVPEHRPHTRWFCEFPGNPLEGTGHLIQKPGHPGEYLADNYIDNLDYIEEHNVDDSEYYRDMHPSYNLPVG